MGKKNSEFVFDERSRDILLNIVKLHIADGEPVGSRTLSKQSRFKLSAATIRNIMADLEEAGFLAQPHTSAGRVPTDKGYRFYVDNLLRTSRVSRSDEELINRSLLFDPEVSPEHLMERASHLLSHISNSVGIVVSPSMAHDIIQHVEFVRLTDKRILVLTVSRTGMVHNRVVRTEEDIPQEELERTTRYVAEHFRNHSLSSIRDQLVLRMSEEKVLYDRLLKNAVLLCSQSLEAETGPASVFVDGTVNMLSRPDFQDLDRMKALFRMFEEKGRLVKIINQCLLTVPDGGISVHIGAENAFPGMRDCTIITSPYYYRNKLLGGIGVVGPTRMEYTRIMSIVGYMARLFNRVLNDQPIVGPHGEKSAFLIANPIRRPGPSLGTDHGR